MVVGRGRLEPEVGELLVQALNAAREVLYQRTDRTFGDASSGDVSTEPPALEQQQADALALVAETALHHGIDPGAPGDRYQVVVHVDAPALADPEAGYEVDRQPDGELRFRRPDGRLLPEVPRAPEVSGDPVKVLLARHDAEGLVIQARITTPGWMGERLDVGYAIDVLHLRCNSEPPVVELQSRATAPLPASSSTEV